MDRPDHGDNLAGYQRILFEDTTHGQARQAGRDSRVLLILYLLTAEKSNTLRDQYYPKLLERKISFGTDTFPFMVNSDKPFVLAWDINNITYVRGDVSATGNEEVTTDEPLSIRFLDGMLTVDCLPGATVNVYSMNGTLTGHQQAVSGKAIFSLPGHLYTVEVVTERYRKVQKVVR